MKRAAEVLRDEAADEWTGRRADAGEAHDRADRPVAALGRERVAEHRHARRKEHRGAHALHHARGHQPVERWRGAQSAEATPNSATPVSSTRRRPKTSPSRPAAMSGAAKARR